MNYLDLPKPHGWLLWRGKKKAIANDTPLLSGEPLLVVSDGEAYGYVTLATPSVVNISEFERLEDEHLVRREDRKLYWPNADKLYLHWLKEWQPLESTKAVKVENGQAEILEDVPLTPEQAELIKQVERLPKTLVLLDEAVTLCDGKAIYCDGVNGDKLAPILDVTLDGVKSADSLPLYQLALVRIPRLSFKEKKSNTSIEEDGKAMPYQKVKRGDEWCVIQTDTEEVKKCYDNEDEATDYLAALNMNVEKEEKALAVFSNTKEMSIDQELNAIRDGFYNQFTVTTGDIVKSSGWLREIYEGYAIAEWDGKTYKISYAKNLDGKIEFSPKSDWKEVELTYREKMKSLIAEARKCYDEGMAMPFTGPTTFAELEALEEARRQAYEAQELTFQFQMLSSNIFNSDDIEDKAAALTALANEYSSLVNQAVKSAEVEADAKTEEVTDDSKVGKRIRQSMKDRLKQAWETIKEVMDWAEPDEEEISKAFGDSSHFAIKQVNGVPWFVSYSANAFEDREGEIFSTKSLEKYVAEAEETGDKGYFNIWHIGTKQNPSLTDFAKIEWQGVVGKFLVEAGPFLDNAKGQAALKFFEQYPESHPEIAPEGWGSSVEYKYLKSERETKVYKNIWKTRTSALPRKVAANTWTKGTIMALSPEQEKAAKAIFGKDLAEQIIKGAEGATKELEEAGVASKEVTAETTTEVVETKVEVESIAEQAAKLVSVDFQPIAEALTLIADNQTKHDTMLQELAGRIKSLEKVEDVKTATETPRFMVSVMNRASQAEKTIVADDDPLKDKKPAETQPVAKSGAAAFFPAR